MLEIFLGYVEHSLTQNSSLKSQNTSAFLSCILTLIFACVLLVLDARWFPELMLYWVQLGPALLQHLFSPRLRSCT